MSFIDRKEAALIMAVMPFLAGCTSRETPAASIPTLPTSTPVTETATPIPEGATVTPVPATATREPSPTPVLRDTSLKSLPPYGVFRGGVKNTKEQIVGDALISRYPPKPDGQERVFVRINTTLEPCRATPTFSFTEKDLLQMPTSMVEKGSLRIQVIKESDKLLLGKMVFKPVKIGGRDCWPEENYTTSFEAIQREVGLRPLRVALTEMVTATGQRPSEDFITKMLESGYGGPLPEETK